MRHEAFLFLFFRLFFKLEELILGSQELVKMIHVYFLFMILLDIYVAKKKNDRKKYYVYILYFGKDIM